MITRIEKFGNNTCGPCKLLDKTLEQVTEVEVIKHDVDEEEELTASKGIRNIPTMIFYNDDKEVMRATGALPLNKILEIIKNE